MPFFTNDITGYGRNDKQIGNGVFGKVYKTDANYAVKVYNFKDHGVSTLREISSMRYLNHPNIIKPHALKYYAGVYSTYMDCAECTLDDLIKNKQHYNFGYDINWYMYQLLRAVQYCHSRNIIHRDIKPHNILLYQNGKLQLADFGSSKLFETNDDSNTYYMCTVPWRAPELLLKQESFSCLIDMWSVGVVFFELLGINYDIRGYTTIEQLKKVYEVLGEPGAKKKRKLNLFSDLALLEKDLLLRLLNWESQRITAVDALNHPYFDGTRVKVDTRWPLVKQLQTPVPKCCSKFPESVRRELFSWFWEIKEEYKLKYRTLFMGYYIFDRFSFRLSEKIEIDNMQGYGAVALSIAVKLFEKAFWYTQDIVEICCNLYTGTHLKNLELEILEYLDYDLYSDYDPILMTNDNVNLVYTGLYLNSEWVATWSNNKFISVSTNYKKGCDKIIDEYFMELKGKVGDNIREKIIDFKK